jgi:hypothetical protein
MARTTTTTKTKPRTRKPRTEPKAKRADATTASVVPAKYRERYAEHGGSSGDDLALRLKKHLAADDGSTDVTKLRALAEANGCWDERYAAVNVGLARMTVSNRLRALVRKGGTVKWGAK